MWSVTDMQTNKTTTVIDLREKCDMKAMFKMLAGFATDMKLEDCVVGIRNYGPDELREDGTTKAVSDAEAVVTASQGSESAEKKAEKKLAKAKKAAHLPVSGSGDMLVTSFDLNVVSFDNTKELEYLFYDDGWPGRVSVFKSGEAFYPTHVELTCHDRGKDLLGRLVQGIAAAPAKEE